MQSDALIYTNMGTNYYFIPKHDELAEIQKAHELVDERRWNDLIDFIENDITEKIHIGKSSMGWQFLFNHNNGKYYAKTRKSIDDFIRGEGNLVDEYGENITPDDFWNIVDNHKDGLNSYTCDENSLISRAYCHDTFSEDGENLRFACSTEFC